MQTQAISIHQFRFITAIGTYLRAGRYRRYCMPRRAVIKRLLTCEFHNAVIKFVQFKTHKISAIKLKKVQMRDSVANFYDLNYSRKLCDSNRYSKSENICCVTKLTIRFVMLYNNTSHRIFVYMKPQPTYIQVLRTIPFSISLKTMALKNSVPKKFPRLSSNNLAS